MICILLTHFGISISQVIVNEIVNFYLILKLNKIHSNIGTLIISFNILSIVNPLVYEYLPVNK